MTERKAQLILAAFTVASAICVPLSTATTSVSLNPSIFAGGTLMMLFLSANPALLLATPAERREYFRRGLVLPLAAYLGVLLIIVGFWLSYR